MVRSLGPEPALAVKVCDQLGSGMTFISVHGATFHRGRPCWTIASLAKGKVRRFFVHVRSLPFDCPQRGDCPRRLVNAATASAEGVRTRTAHASLGVVAERHLLVTRRQM